METGGLAFGEGPNRLSLWRADTCDFIADLPFGSFWSFGRGKYVRNLLRLEKSRWNCCVEKHRDADQDRLDETLTAARHTSRHDSSISAKRAGTAIVRGHQIASPIKQLSIKNRVRTFLFFRPRGSHITNKSFITLMVLNSHFLVESFWVLSLLRFKPFEV